MNELRKMDLYITGKLMRNRLPKEVTIMKTSAEYKQMNRGDYRSHQFYKLDGKDDVYKAGLVCWKDQDVVYCLWNEMTTAEHDVCKQCSKNGLITMNRPKMIVEYNTYMGRVDLADMRKLHCNSTIMGQNHW